MPNDPTQTTPNLAEIVEAIRQQFRCFGGADQAIPNNPIEAAYARGPLVFALGVNVTEVVRFVLEAARAK